jgi:hypothetical protein
MVHSLAVKVQASSTPSAKTASKATAELQLSANIFQDSGPLAEQPIAATNSSQ